MCTQILCDVIRKSPPEQNRLGWGTPVMVCLGHPPGARAPPRNTSRLTTPSFLSMGHQARFVKNRGVFGYSADHLGCQEWKSWLRLWISIAVTIIQPGSMGGTLMPG